MYVSVCVYVRVWVRVERIFSQGFLVAMSEFLARFFFQEKLK